MSNENTQNTPNHRPAVGGPVQRMVRRPVEQRDYIRAQVAPGVWANVPKRCEYCDDPGDVTGFDGEWRGYCVCGAGQALKAPNVGGNRLAPTQE